MHEMNTFRNVLINLIQLLVSDSVKDRPFKSPGKN
jgi:hypothetical protein